MIIGGVRAAMLAHFITEKTLMSIQLMEKAGKDFGPNFDRTILEMFRRRSCNDGNQELIAIFHSPHRKGRASLTVVTHTLDQLV